MEKEPKNKEKQEAKPENKAEVKPEKVEKPEEINALIKKELELKDMITCVQRLQAEFENYKKRTDCERLEYCKVANEGLILELLQVIDDFELAIQQSKNKDDFFKGIELIYAKFYSLLEKEGLKRIEALNKRFDPYFHEALLAEVSDKPENTVLEELQKGYTLNGKVIRHTKVKIAKKKKENEKVRS